ncbi:hypothetical protein SUGI_0778740 [Cryptomeria japonica]|nr:hypothetical protein SUGI_0778740 [Cryptomeria japonica]
MRLPPAFVPKLRNETETGSIVVLQGPTSQHWVVKLCSIGTEMEFGQGWEQFVHHNAIELGDFLVFKYISTSYFKVRIFGRSGCEKNVSVFDAEKKNCDLVKRCPDPLPAGVSLNSVESMDSKPPVYLVSDEEEKNDKREAVAENQWKKLKPSPPFCPKCPKPSPPFCPKCPIPSPPFFPSYPLENRGCWQPSVAGKKHQAMKAAENGTEEKSFHRTHYISCRRPVTEAERNQALEAAQSFTLNTPFCFITMKPSHVYHTFWVSMPLKFRYLQLPRERMEVILVGPNNKEWHVQYLGNRTTPVLRGGWKYFSRDNNLEEGDVCVFELENNSKNKIRVHIFRVVNTCTPYKKTMEGELVNHSISLPTFHSSKKLQVNEITWEDPAHNLSEKPFGPEQGTDARPGINEVQGSKRASSGSNYLDILDKKAACKDNTSFSEKCYLPEFQQTKLLHPASSADEQKSIGRNTAVLANEISHLDGVKDKEDLMITVEGNDASHGMPAITHALIPSQEHILEGPLMNELVPLVSPSPEVVSLVVALSPEAATALADMNGEAT